MLWNSRVDVHSDAADAASDSTTPTATNVLTNVADVLLVQGVGAVGLNGQTQAATGAHGSVQLLQNRVARHRHDAEH